MTMILVLNISLFAFLGVEHKQIDLRRNFSFHINQDDAKKIYLFEALNGEKEKEQKLYSPTITEKELKKNWKKWLTKFPRPKGAIELEPIETLSNGKLARHDTYLWRPLSLQFLSNGNIAVNDQKASQILIFDTSASIVRKIGKKGQGPGEFLNPYTISATPNHIVVGDNGNMRIHFFDYQGNFLKGFKVFKAYIDLAASKNGLIFAAPLRISPESALVDVLDENGQLLRAFGKAKFGNAKSSWQISNFIKMSLSGKDELFIAYEHFPVVCKYSREGELLAEYKIENEVMREKEKINMARINKGISLGLMPIIFSIYSNKEGFSILSIFPRVEILEYDNNGKFLSHYFYEYEYRSYDVFFRDFIISEKNGKKYFYLLKTAPENEIIILRPKKYLN